MQEFSNFSINLFGLHVWFEKQAKCSFSNRRENRSFRFAKVTNFPQLLPIIGKYVAS